MSVKLRIVVIVIAMGTCLVLMTAIATLNLLNIRGSVAAMAGETAHERFLVELEKDLISLGIVGQQVFETTRSGQPTDTAPLQEALRTMDRDLAEMRTWLADQPSFEEVTGAIMAALESRRALVQSIDLDGKVGDYDANETRALTMRAARGISGLASVLATGAEAHFDDTLSEINTALVWTIALSTIGIVVGTTYSMWTSVTQITRPLSQISARLSELTDGNLDGDIKGTDRRDEIGGLAKSAAQLQSRLREIEQIRAAARKEREERAASTRANIEKQVSRLDHDVNSVIRTLSDAATQLTTRANQLRANAQTSSTQSDRVSHAAEETSSNVQAVASAAEELAASAQEIGSQVSQSTQISMQALQQAERTTTVVAGLSDSARKIGQVVDLIEDIASQTNLLALNATIEAARAGDAGKGFAVVAMEVKSLAEQTGNATKEISSQINAVQADVNRVVEAIQSLKESFSRANELASAVASAIEEQSAATGAIAQSVQQAAVSTQDVSSIIVDVSKAANDTGSGAGDIVSASNDLSTQADTLRSRMANFIASMRSDAA